MDRSYRPFALAISLAIVTVVGLVLAADGPEWPRFRGPQGNPVSTVRLPDTWSKTENVEWKAVIPGRGWSSPIVSGNRVFVTAATTDGNSKKPQIGTQYSNEYITELQKQGLSEQEIEARVIARDFELPNEVTLHYFLYCVDLKTGKVNWKQEYHSGRPPGGRHRKNSFTSETPVTDGKLVYVYATSLGLWAYDMKGRVVWKTPLENYPMYGDFGTGASPVLAGTLLVIVSDNEKQQFIAAFDKKTGKQVWRTNRDLKAGNSATARRTGWSTPYIWTTPGRTELVTIGPGFAVSYDLSGKELWRLAGMGGGPIPSPYASGGLLFLNGGSGGVLAAGVA
ncbi:MAG: PQQ-binding-like beta-propeller repeat protein, partial [Acidobacteriota bacterium]